MLLLDFTIFDNRSLGKILFRILDIKRRKATDFAVKKPQISKLVCHRFAIDIFYYCSLIEMK